MDLRDGSASAYIVTDLTYGEAALRAAALFRGGKLDELEVRRKDKESRIGQIVLGVIDTVERSLGGAFVRIGHTERAFMPLKGGHFDGCSKLPVLITKDAQGVKQAACTDRLTLAGRLAVVTEGRRGYAFSSKLKYEEREALKKALDPSLAADREVLIRTNARDVPPEAVEEEIRGLADILKGAREKAGEKAYSVLYRPPAFYDRLLRDFPEVPDRIVSDIPAVVSGFQAAGFDKAELYEETAMTLAERAGLVREIDKLTQRVAWMKSGAYLVIEPTEALISIDVNSGHRTKGRSAAETYREVNYEAIEEAARQIRLRDLSGMILIDLIKMKEDSDKEELLKYAREVFARDRRHTEVADITKLGLLEIIRQKSGAPLAERLKP